MDTGSWAVFMSEHISFSRWEVSYTGRFAVRGASWECHHIRVEMDSILMFCLILLSALFFNSIFSALSLTSFIEQPLYTQQMCSSGERSKGGIDVRGHVGEMGESSVL